MPAEDGRRVPGAAVGQPGARCGVACLRGPGRAFDAELERDIRALYRDFYHLELTDVQLQALLTP